MKLRPSEIARWRRPAGEQRAGRNVRTRDPSVRNERRNSGSAGDELAIYPLRNIRGRESDQLPARSD
jgi:hypothetical protein